MQFTNDLLNSILPAAQHLLEKNGEFYPIGMSVNGEGVMGFVAFDEGSEKPVSADVIAGFRGAFVQAAAQNQLQACAIAYDISFSGHPETTDAIAVALEEPGASALVAVPYVREEDSYQYFDIIRLPYDPSVFK